MDFMAYQPAERFDLVICLQVLEHLPEAALFARKLVETVRTIIVSVPYKWPKGKCRWHLQDPVDETKLDGWMQKKPIDVSVVTDREARMVAVYQGENLRAAQTL